MKPIPTNSEAAEPGTAENPVFSSSGNRATLIDDCEPLITEEVVDALSECRESGIGS